MCDQRCVAAEYLIHSRLKLDTDRKDFMHYILQKEESKEYSLDEFAMEAQIFM